MRELKNTYRPWSEPHHLKNGGSIYQGLQYRYCFDTENCESKKTVGFWYIIQFLKVSNFSNLSVGFSGLLNDFSLFLFKIQDLNEKTVNRSILLIYRSIFLVFIFSKISNILNRVNWFSVNQQNRSRLIFIDIVIQGIYRIVPIFSQIRPSKELAVCAISRSNVHD
jgi:hypothetical protein